MSAQPTLPGTAVPRLFACTPTRLTTWLDCPRRYRFSYLDRPPPPKGPPWAHTSVGAAVHTALAAWWLLPAPQRTPDAGVAQLCRGWDPMRHAASGFSGPQQSLQARDRAAAWIERYLADVDPEDEPAGVERTVSTPTRSLVLSGRVDRIDRRDGDQLVVVDYKTGRRAPEVADLRSSLAMASYAVATARTLRRPCTRVEFHHLPSGTVIAAEHDEVSLARKVDEAESVAVDVRRAEQRAGKTGRPGRGDDEIFPPHPGRLCSWCDWRRSCPEGQAAAPELEPWAGLDLS